MASEEFSLLPKPLSESDQKVPSAMVLMPEKPCTGWPSKGSDRPVGRTPSLPGTDAELGRRACGRRVENLPEVFRRSSGASAERRDDGVGGQDRMAFERGGELLVLGVSAGEKALRLQSRTAGCCAWWGSFWG